MEVAAAVMPSETALLRNELAKMNTANKRLEEFVKSLMHVVSTVIPAEVEKRKSAEDRADRLQEEVTGLRKRCGIRESWNSRPSENREYEMNRAKFRAAAAEYEAKQKGTMDGVDSSDVVVDSGNSGVVVDSGVGTEFPSLIRF